MNLRDAQSEDFSTLHILNEANTPHVNSLSLERFCELAERSNYFRVVEDQGEICGSLMVFAPGADYNSLNYQWFSSRFQNFLYVDRIMVAEFARRKGVASALYRDLEALAKERSVDSIFCEYNIVPPNPVSQQFHARHGFLEVGQQETEGGTKRVSLQRKAVSPDV